MRISDALLDLLFPPKCPYCEKILDAPRAPACPGCQARLPWLEGKEGERSVDFASGCYSPLSYGELTREAIHRYKFQRVRALGSPFAAPMARRLEERLPGGAASLPRLTN